MTGARMTAGQPNVRVQGEMAGIGAQLEEHAVREVHDAEQAEYDGEADGDQDVKATKHKNRSPPGII